MILKKFIFIISMLVLTNCSSDEIISAEKKNFYEIFKGVTNSIIPRDTKKVEPKLPRRTSNWLSKFNQPIILISSLNGKNQATLVALGNNDEKLTWVSADGISLTYDRGVLIATRGYSEDLLALMYSNPAHLFKSKKLNYKRVHRYLNGENQYADITFQCFGRKVLSQPLNILEYKLIVDKFIEKCSNSKHSYTNEYDLLSNTSIVIKSKQWVSPTNNSFMTYNFYAFQKF